MDRGDGWLGLRMVGVLGALIYGLVVTPNAAAERTVYTTASSGSVSALEVAPSGGLSPVAGSPYPTGSSPNAVVATPDGRHLYVANTASSNVSAYTIAPDGALTPVPGSPFAASTAPNALAASPDGRHLYSGNLDSTVSVFEIGAAGALTAIAGSPFAVGFEPYALAIAPDGRRVYASNTTIPSDGVHGFSIADDGSITELPGSPYALPPFSGQTLAVTVTPDGRNLYVGVGNNDVVGYGIAADGELTTVPGSPFNANLWSLTASPDGRHVYTADRFANDQISGFAIEGDGSLTALQGSPYAVTPSPSRPMAVVVSPDSSHIYASSGAPFAQDFGFSIAADGSLAPLAGSPFAGAAQAGSHSIAISPNQGPTAGFTASAAPAGQPTAFDGSASADPDGTIARYDWDFGDGTTLSDGGPQPTHLYADAGDYQATLTVTDNEGCSTTVVYTGQTASCNGSGAARQTNAVTFDLPPAITGLRVKPKSFAADAEPTALTKRGARIVLKLSENAKVRFRIRRDPARKSGGPKPRNPRTFKRRLDAGKSSVAFTATLGKRTFRPGRYQVIARARDSANQPSKRQRARFTITG